MEVGGGEVRFDEMGGGLSRKQTRKWEVEGMRQREKETTGSTNQNPKTQDESAVSASWRKKIV